MATISITRLDVQPISDKSKQGYKAKLEYLEKISGRKIDWLMLNPKAGLKFMKRNISEQPATLASYVTAICKMFTIYPTFKKEHEAEYGMWGSYLNHYNNAKRLQYEENGLDEKQQDNMVSFNMMKERFCALEKDAATFVVYKQHLQYILLAMFLHIKPKRADLGDVLLCEDRDVPQAYAKKNYLILKKDADTGTLVINEHKTAKRYGALREELTPELTAILKRSVLLFPRSHLFVSLTEPIKYQPYTKNNSYSQYVKRVFEKNFGKSMGVSLWRHVYIKEHVDFNDDSYANIKKAARLSGHSVETQMLIYKPTGEAYPIERRKREDIGKPITCDNKKEGASS